MGSISHCNTQRSFYSLILLLMNEFQIANPMPSGTDHTRGAEHGQCLASLLAACEAARGTHHRLWLLLETNQCLSMTIPRQCGSSVWTQFICSLLQIQQCFFPRIFELRRKDTQNAQHYVDLLHLLGGGQLDSLFCRMFVHCYS